jgi:HSP20 family protein
MAGMTSLRREMDRLFDRFFDTEASWEASMGGESASKVDLSDESKEAYVHLADPGVDQKDVQVSLQDQLLTIKGRKCSVR